MWCMVCKEKSVLGEVCETLRGAVSVSPEKAAMFFKTGPGDYAEGDLFIGVTVPNIRKVAKQYPDLGEAQLRRLLQSKINEERLLALIILVGQYERGDFQEKQRCFDFYCKHLKHVNNWNLVDLSAHYIVGDYLWDKKRDLLLELARSEDLWERRVAIVATWYFIKKDDLKWTFRIGKLLMRDTHDLIHKAVGWMLREAGKRDEAALMAFLDNHATRMPRTMLRYAIEKFDERQRKHYLSLK